MIWNLPPKFKFYEALGVLADNRLVIIGNMGENLFEDSNSIIEAKSYSLERYQSKIQKRLRTSKTRSRPNTGS